MKLIIFADNTQSVRLKNNMEDIITNIPAEDISIYTYTAEMTEDIKKEYEKKYSDILKFVNISDVCDDEESDRIRTVINKATGETVSKSVIGYYVEQYVKLKLAKNIGEEEFIIMKPELIPILPLSCREASGRPVLFYKETGTLNRPEDIFSRLFEKGRDGKIYRDEIMYFKKDIFLEMITRIENNGKLAGEGAFEKIILTMDKSDIINCSADICGLYGAYAGFYNMEDYGYSSLRVLERGRRLLGDHPDENVKKWVSKSYDCIKLRKQDRPSEALIRFNNKSFVQAVISVSLEDKLDHKTEVLSDRWSKVTDFSIRLTVGREINRLRNLKRFITERFKRKTPGAIKAPKGVDGCIVLTHSGIRPIPAYAADCIEQIRLFSDIPIYFICGKDKEVPGRIADNAYVVRLEDLPVCKEHLRFYGKLSSFASKFDNFFQHASERFFIINEAVSCLKLKNVIHMENDIMLYEDAYKLLEKIKEHYTDITVPRMTERYCMAAVMYIPDNSSLERFLDYINEHILDKGTNDMIMLAGYLREKGLLPLPIINEEYVKDNVLRNKKGETAPKEYISEYSSYIDDFRGLFDPAPIGQYLGGTDRKPKGVADNAGYENIASYIDISGLFIDWEKNEGKNVPFLLYKDKKYRIFNLHVHCKELNRFRSDIEQ
ncbi:MAG: hypothetical protein K6E98_09075 [Lachnospiraceae bacterium]|nr:hypothetical protein [Lachnospiraceae bacterium]